MAESVGARASADNAAPAAATLQVDVEMGDALEAPAVDEVEEGPAVTQVPSDASTVNSWQQHARSQWRWPSGPGKLPGYVRGRFRAKTFFLLALQLTMVFSIMMVVDVTLSKYLTKINTGVLFFALELVTMILLVTLHWIRDRYPGNYLLLGLISLMVSFRWGIASSFFITSVHFQVVGILCVGMWIATITSAIRARHTANGWHSVVLPLLLGWVVGSIVDIVIASRLLGIHWASALLAIGITLVLLGWLLLDVGRRLITCNPDDFMRIVVAMNSTLLVVVSIPLFAFGTFLIHATDRESELGIRMRQAAEQAAEQRQADHVQQADAVQLEAERGTLRTIA